MKDKKKEKRSALQFTKTTLVHLNSIQLQQVNVQGGSTLAPEITMCCGPGSSELNQCVTYTQTRDQGIPPTNVSN